MNEVRRGSYADHAQEFQHVVRTAEETVLDINVLAMVKHQRLDAWTQQQYDALEAFARRNGVRITITDDEDGGETLVAVPC